MPAIPAETDRYPMCATIVSTSPEWVRQVLHGDGATVFFDSKDLYRYLSSLG